jgi:hypothetical protein
MSKNALKFDFVWKILKLKPKLAIFLISIIYSGQSLGSTRTRRIFSGIYPDGPPKIENWPKMGLYMRLLEN